MSSQAPPVVDVSTQLDLVGESRRRLALEVLAANDTPLTLRDLATEIVTCEHDAPLHDAPEGAVRSVHISLAHVHIPKFVDPGVIEYDETRNHIQKVDFDRLEPTLSALTDAELE